MGQIGREPSLDNGRTVDALPVVILAAGRGRRLGDLTSDRPKCLLPVRQHSPLGLVLDYLRGSPPRELVVVTGHGSELIRDALSSADLPFPVREVFNPLYDTANNIYSALLAREHVGGGFVLVNSDVICHPAILDSAFSAPDGTFLVVDPTEPPRSEAMKVRYEAGRLVAIGKDLDPVGASGEYIGIARFDPEGAAAFFRAVEEILAAGGSGEWYEAAIGRASAGIFVGKRSTGGLPWIEIDDPEDLLRAEREIVPSLSKAGPGTKL